MGAFFAGIRERDETEPRGAARREPGARRRRPARVAAALAVLALAPLAGRARASECDSPQPGWLACEDFESGGLGWKAWFAQSPWVLCDGCPNGVNDPARIRLTNQPGAAHTGKWALYMPAEAAANYRGASLEYRDCAGTKKPGCTLTNHDQLYFRVWVKLAPDHQYVHHFLALAGTQPDQFWNSEGNAGCRPNGSRWAGTTLDFNAKRELHFYTYFPDMHCDSGGYCSGSYAQNICDECATKDMPCTNGLECCWGNNFFPNPRVVLPRGKWECLEMMAKLNTPGQADGVMAFWMNDQLVLRKSGMNWRDTTALGLNKAWLQHYIAAGDATQSNAVWFDDVVVSTSRIGCGAAAAPASDGGAPPPPMSDGGAAGAGSGDAGPGGAAAGGCGCRVGASSTGTSPLALLLFAIPLGWLRRRARDSLHVGSTLRRWDRLAGFLRCWRERQ